MQNIPFSTILKVIPFLLFFSCIDGRLPEEETEIENLLNITIDGEDYQLINESFGSDLCDILHYNSYYYDKDKIRFRIDFEISKEGDLLKVWYDELKLPLEKGGGNVDIYLAPNYNPTSTFNISNFIYNENTGEVKFDFEGTVFYEMDNDKKRSLSGDFEMKVKPFVDCRYSKTGLNYQSDQLRLKSFLNSFSKSANQNQTHRFYSNNGFKIYIQTSGDLWLYPIGELFFTEDDHLDKVEFKQLIAPNQANQIRWINEADWENYETSGSINILNKYIEEGKKVIHGTINLLAKKDGELIYDLHGVEFKTGSFER